MRMNRTFLSTTNMVSVATLGDLTAMGTSHLKAHVPRLEFCSIQLSSLNNKLCSYLTSL